VVQWFRRVSFSYYLSLLDDLNSFSYNKAMRTTLTSKGQITVPARIRKRLGLRPGQALEFDENAPFLKAVPVFDEDAMRSVIGSADRKPGETAAEWLDETRGSVELPGSNS
jgi:AbrB family looped-hinge helix DNA binding protein